MAEPKPSLSTGQEELFEFTCSQCMDEEEKVSEAIAYCPECSAYFCKLCLETHRRFLLTKKHLVADETRKEEWGKRKLQGRTGKECAKHDGETIVTYCGTHDVICCQVCASTDHRTCQDMKPVADVAKGVTSTPEFQDITTKVDVALTEIDDATATKQQDQSDYNISNEKVLSDIHEFRLQIIAAIDRLEDRVRNDTKYISEPISDDITSSLVTCERISGTFKRFKDAMQNPENLDDVVVFITMKQCQKEMAEYKKMIKMLAQAVSPSMIFVANSPLLQDIKNATCLGEIEFNSCFTNNLYKVSTPVIKPNVKIATDTKTCYIDGICQTLDGQIIVTDAFNLNVKRLGQAFNVVDHCGVPDRPNAVCSTGENQVVVALESKGLQFITIGAQMTKTKLVDLGHKSFGVAYYDNKLYVSDKEKKVYIHAMSGGLLRTIQTGAAGADLFNATRHLAISGNGARIYVTDREKGLVILDREGKLMNTLTDSSLQGARGVCLDCHGNVFIQCCLSSNIAQVDPMGEAVLGVVVEKKDGIFAPGAAVFDKTSSALVVTSSPRKGGDTLDVCHLGHSGM